LCSPTSSLFGGAYGLSKALLNSYTLCLAREQPQLRAGYANTPETRWYYVLYVLKFILYNTAMYYLSVQ